jgi:hypothetical protein
VDASPLAASLLVVRELAGRRGVLDMREASGGPEALAVELEVLFEDARAGSTRAREAAIAVASWIAHRAVERPRLLEPIRAAAVRAGLPLASALLSPAEATASLASGGRLAEVCLPARKPFTVPHDDTQSGRLRFYGTGWGFQRREQLRRHPDPVMVGRLLDESWFRLGDVLVIASRRPSVPAIAWAIATRDHWFGRPRVRDALVANPFTPATLALALLPSTQASTLRRLAQGRAGAVRDAARRFG